jgi:hypothetical protein
MLRGWLRTSFQKFINEEAAVSGTTAIIVLMIRFSAPGSNRHYSSLPSAPAWSHQRPIRLIQPLVGYPESLTFRKTRVVIGIAVGFRTSLRRQQSEIKQGPFDEWAKWRGKEERFFFRASRRVIQAKIAES